MRDYGKAGASTWTDYKGRVWPVVTSVRRLKFKYPAHAALREHIYVRDGFKCCRCCAVAVSVPEGWDGKSTLFTNTKVSSGYPDMLILDHMLTLKAGGKNVLSNFQTLCETCNRRKQKEDIAAANNFKAEAI